MKKLFILLLIFILTACTKEISQKNPHEILLAMKNYSCTMEISFFSNKNTNKYIANQTYSSIGKYSMEFLDDENLKINYENSILNIHSKSLNASNEIINYEEINKNPLFLSYFINIYFNTEEKENIKTSTDSINITLPNSNEYLYSANLIFKNNKPHTLTYYDKNGNEKVNILYSEFTLTA